MKAQQQAFVDAVLGRTERPAELRGSEAGFAAYRNNVRALSAQALAVAFPRLHEALGADDFASLAWTFWRALPPVSGDLGQWGGDLEAFVLARAGEDSGLPDLARLDWAMHQAERAADAALDAASLQLLATVAPEQLWLQLRPGVAVIRQQAGAVLVWRNGWRAQSQALPAAEAEFVGALLEERSLGEALSAAEVKGLAGEPDFDFGAWLQAALHNAWLQSARTTTPPQAGPT